MPRYQSDNELRGLLESLYRHRAVISDAFPSNKPPRRVPPAASADDPDLAPGARLDHPLDLEGLSEDVEEDDLNQSSYRKSYCRLLQRCSFTGSLMYHIREACTYAQWKY